MKEEYVQLFFKKVKFVVFVFDTHCIIIHRRLYGFADGLANTWHLKNFGTAFKNTYCKIVVNSA